MKRFIEVILEHASIFLGNSRASKAIETDSKEEIKNNIELALYKNASIHVIYGNRSFTGDIVKYDTERQRIIMKNFKRQVTSIINLEDIQKITLVPESVKTSQQQEKKTEQHTGNRKNA
ncbi:TPA: hypothetical protein ACGORE_000924 [Streptococcus suis]